MKTLLAIVLLAGVMSAGCFVNVGHYLKTDGSTIYVGDFYNDQPGPGYGPAEVRGTLYDGSGNLIDTTGGFLCLGVDPKGLIPFKTWTFTDPAKVARIDWNIVDQPTNPLLATGLEPRITNTFAAGGLTYVVGEVTNTSKNVYIAAVVCASWTDNTGKVVRESWNNGGAWRFNPGDTLPFSLPVDTPPNGSTIHLYLDANVTDIPGAVANSAIEIPINALQHDFQKTVHTADSYFTIGMGEVRNLGPSPHFLPDAVATVRDGAGKLLATRGDPSQCIVNAAPGSFTYMTYTLTAPATAATPPAVILQGFQANDRPVYFPKTGDVQFHVDAAKQTITVTGTLTNESAAVLQVAHVCAGAYDAHGVVRNVGMNTIHFSGGGLAVGASAPFTVELSDPTGGAAPPDVSSIKSVKTVADGSDSTAP